MYFTISGITDLNQIKSDGSYDVLPTIAISQNPGFTIYQIENQLVKFYNTFLTEYNICFPTIQIDSNYENISDCNKANNALSQAQNMQKILNIALGQIPPELKMDKGSYDASYQYITSNYNKLLTTRNQLDQQMKDIQKSSDSVYSTYKGSHDSTIYSQILLTVLATSLIYYVFIKL